MSMIRPMSRIPHFKPIAALVAVLSVAAVGAGVAIAGGPGGGGSSATGVLAQTFSGSQDVRSGVLNLSLTVTPSGGSGPLSQPLTLTVNGPFQTNGPRQPPSLDLTANATAFGQSGSAGVISTGHAAYVTFEGSTYALPGRAMQKLRSALKHDAHISRAHSRFMHAHSVHSHSTRAHGMSAGGGLNMLTRLGINPSAWLVNPTVVSTNATAGGVSSTEVSAGVNVATLAQQLYGALMANGGRRGGGTLPASIPPAISSELAGVQATVQVYSGNADHILRKLVLDANVPVPTMLQPMLGGVTSASIVLSVELDNLNQPQAITAPTNVQPFRALRARVSPMLMGICRMLGGHEMSGLLGR
jgi:hypothetical protein